ncbi:hypothetical protein chiPu_0018105 [Chiloscyllium punctatum]|uniref:Uncharacterized protein n=1 Tax=Chiloscyllium punctatum TaxID=137246 RepID=A0A401RL33_CHIPU|nr:hypothetical protein [Chiloscyllium punctatum]
MTRIQVSEIMVQIIQGFIQASSDKVGMHVRKGYIRERQGVCSSGLVEYGSRLDVQCEAVTGGLTQDSHEFLMLGTWIEGEAEAQCRQGLFQDVGDLKSQE